MENEKIENKHVRYRAIASRTRIIFFGPFNFYNNYKPYTLLC